MLYTPSDISDFYNIDRHFTSDYLHENMSNYNTALNLAFNANEAQKSRDHSTFLSDTAHRREVRDLIAAGLNPVLSTGGNGAAAFSTSSANANPSGALDAMVSMNNARLTSAATIKAAEKSAGMVKYSAEMAAQASKYASDSSRAASKYSADISRSATKYASNRGLQGTRYAADRGLQGAAANAAATRSAAAASAAAAKFAAMLGLEGTKYATDFSKSGSWAGLLGSSAKKSGFLGYLKKLWSDWKN